MEGGGGAVVFLFICFQLVLRANDAFICALEMFFSSCCLIVCLLHNTHANDDVAAAAAVAFTVAAVSRLHYTFTHTQYQYCLRIE